MKKSHSNLIRVYWDIENISPGQLGVESFFNEVDQKLESLFGKGCTPPLITIACNVRRTNPKMLEFITKNGVIIRHIEGSKTEQADRELERSIRHDLTHSPESHFVMITHDNDFVQIIREMKRCSSSDSKIVYMRPGALCYRHHQY
mgnify:CR=1 FL=1